MEKRIKRLRQVASICRVLATLAAIAFVLLIFNYLSKKPIASSIEVGAAFPLAVFYYIASLVLDFLAALAEEIEALKWSVADVRRKVVAAHEEETKIN